MVPYMTVLSLPSDLSPILPVNILISLPSKTYSTYQSPSPRRPARHIDLPPLEDLLDVSIERLRELENTTLKDTDKFFSNETPDVDPLNGEGDD